MYLGKTAFSGIMSRMPCSESSADPTPVVRTPLPARDPRPPLAHTLGRTETKINQKPKQTQGAYTPRKRNKNQSAAQADADQGEHSIDCSNPQVTATSPGRESILSISMKERTEQNDGPIVLRTKECEDVTCRTRLEFIGDEHQENLFNDRYAEWILKLLGEITFGLQLDYSLIGGLPFTPRTYRFRFFFDPDQRKELDHGRNVPDWSDIGVREGSVVTDYGYLAGNYEKWKRVVRTDERLEKSLDIETLRALLHEIFHLTHIQELGPHNGKIPSWLKEGMAERLARWHIGLDQFRTDMLLDTLSKPNILKTWPNLREIGKLGHFGISTAKLSENTAYLSSMMASIGIFDELLKKGLEPLPFIFELARRSDSVEHFEALLFGAIGMDSRTAKETLQLQEEGRSSYARTVTRKHGGYKRDELWDAALYDPSAFF